MLSFLEIAVVAGAILLIFGSTKLPKLGRSLGESLTEFKKGLKEGMKNEEDLKSVKQVDVDEDNKVISDE